jgi:molecular chaperone DnaK (HSP70)
LDDDELRLVIDETSVEQGVSSDYVLETSKTTITTVATKSYGVRAKKDGVPVVRNLIVRQTPTPTVGSQIFFTEDADADYVELRVFSNNSSESDATLEESVEIGTAKLDLPTGLPARSKVRIDFNLSPEGRLEMTAVEEATNTQVNATFQADVGMSEEEIAAAKERSRDLIVE